MLSSKKGVRILQSLRHWHVPSGEIGDGMFKRLHLLLDLIKTQIGAGRGHDEDGDMLWNKSHRGLLLHEDSAI